MCRFSSLCIHPLLPIGQLNFYQLATSHDMRYQQLNRTYDDTLLCIHASETMA